jgi:hypothetical protein
MVGSSPNLRCELVSTEQTTTMNIVATPILAIKGIAVNKDFGKGHLADLSESVGTLQTKPQSIRSGEVVLDKCLLIFDNIRAHSK